MAKNQWKKKPTKNTAGHSTGITMTYIWCLLCGMRSLRKLFVNRHWKSHCDKGHEFKGKPCSSYQFQKKGNRYDLDEVSASQPCAPSTTMHPKTDFIKNNFEISTRRISDLLWALEAKLTLKKPCIGLHFWVS